MKHFTAALKEKKLLFNFFKRIKPNITGKKSYLQYIHTLSPAYIKNRNKNKENGPKLQIDVLYCLKERKMFMVCCVQPISFWKIFFSIQNYGHAEKSPPPPPLLFPFLPFSPFFRFFPPFPPLLRQNS